MAFVLDASIAIAWVVPSQATPYTIAHRVNVLLDDAIWAALSKAPQGERSRIVNNALKQSFQRRLRRDAARRMDELRALIPPVSTKQIVAWVREERDRAE